MSTTKKYAFWNNKGGVGKTFLCFASACEYAKTHPTTQVVVIDACPQANISEIILGGNSTGDDKLTGLLKKSTPQTIGGYYQQRAHKPFEKTGTESGFLIKARDYNANMPDNLYLIAGDPSLELQVEFINLYSLPTAASENAWKLVHLWVKDLQDAAVNKFGEDCAFFVDCNPSFSAYTKQVMLAADRLITPCTADGSSARAIDNAFKLLYGFGVPPQYIKASFKSQADAESLSLPTVYLVPMNRSTIHGNRPASAFRAMFDKIKYTVDEMRKSNPQYFYTHKGRDVFIDIPDAHTVAVVSSYTGTPISDIKVGPYDLWGDEKTQVNAEPLDRYCNAVKDFVALL